MINNDYLIELEDGSSGSYCDVLPVKDHPNLLFKGFKKESKALEAYNNQIKLSEYDLAPRIIGEPCQIAYYYPPELLKNFNPQITRTNLGYLTEKAELTTDEPFDELQELCDRIKVLVKKDFWDCHFQNVGYIYRSNEKVLCCIDTGEETFDGKINTWGFDRAGPKCTECGKYKCLCLTDHWRPLGGF